MPSEEEAEYQVARCFPRKNTQDPLGNDLGLSNRYKTYLYLYIYIYIYMVAVLPGGCGRVANLRKAKI